MPHVLLGDIDRDAVNGEGNTTQETQAKACGGDDDVSVKLLA